MSRHNLNNSKNREGLELFSDMMLMKFKPKSEEGEQKIRKNASIRKQILCNKSNKISNQEQERLLSLKLDHILYLELASRDTVILGNYNQLDMIDLDGMTNGFVDTYHYWSFCPGIPIMNFRVNAKKQVMLVHSLNNVMVYTYQTIKTDTNKQPQFVANIQIKDQVKFLQFPTSDLIAIFYQKYFEIYSLSDSYVVQKKLEKKYNIDGKNFKIFSVPQGIDNTVNIFFEQVLEKSKVFGLWCIEVNLFSQTIRQNQPYKIYDIQKSLKEQMLLRNYSKQVIVLNLGQQILIASKGYIVDSVNINLQLGNTYLKLIPHRHTLLHIQNNFMEVYQFTINTTVFPHRIELSSLDSIEINSVEPSAKLINVVPVFDNNYALFYQLESSRTTKGEIFYQFMMSYTVKLSEKINKILNLQVPLSDMAEDKIENKCDVLRKIGLTDEEIYKQLWKRSNQTSVKDYQFLLSTRSYKVIKGEIENKMRKVSMRFKQLIKIQQSCLDIQRGKIKKQTCQAEDIKDYFVSHLLLRKLNLFKQIQLVRNKQLIEKEKVFNMNIQQYYTFKNFKFQDVVQKIGLYLNKGEGSIKQIRTILYHFRFVYRFIYYQLLEDIVKEVKYDIKRLLIQMPQLLPLNKAEDNQTDVLSEGIWKQINEMQWQSSLWYEKVACINNRQVLDQVIHGVWFKRNWLNMHDMIPHSKEQIIQRNKKNGAPEIFYFFVEKLYENIKDQDILRDLLRYIQSHYEKFPAHIRKKVILYSKLYQHVREHDQIRNHQMSFSKFLTLQDPHLFQIFFELEKVRKGCLLHEIRQIYVSYGADKNQSFNQSLLAYFKSDISQISHLKYLLNRINNEKKEFHTSHQSMYAVLVRAMQIKLRIGGPEDIPIDEVLIYLENIPIASPNSQQIIKDLELIQKISEEYETLKNMKINMTIRQIIENYEVVMQKLVDYQIEKFELWQIDDEKQFITNIYRILAEIQSFKKNIYSQQQNELAFFILVTKLMQKQNKIRQVRVLLKDQYINNYFYLDINTIENLVKYMYKWKFSQNNTFPANQSYILCLIQLLPQHNNYKSFILKQVEFAKLLSTNKQPVKYPLSTYTPYPRLEQLQQILKNFDKQTLKTIEIDKVVNNMLSLRQLSQILDLDMRTSSFEGSFLGGNTSVYINVNGGSLSNVDAHNLSVDAGNNSLMNSMVKKADLKDQQIYQVFIKIYISKGLVRQVLPLLRKSIQMAEQYNVITILLLLYRLFAQLNDESKIYIIKIASLLYNNPTKLFQIVEQLIVKQMTSLQISSYTQKQYNKIKELKLLNYNVDNLVFNTHFRSSEDEDQKLAKNQLVKKTLVRLKRRRPQFRSDFLFDFLYVIVCHHPESISIFLKYTGVSKSKLTRSFFSHLITQDIFDQLHVMEIMKRVYYFLLRSIRSNRSVESIIRKYSDVSLVQDFQVKQLNHLNQTEKKIWTSVKAFQRKKQNILEINKSHKLQDFLKIDKQKSIKQSLENADRPLEASRQQYVFSDSDDDYEVTEKQANQSSNHMLSTKSKSNRVKFNKNKERMQFYKRTPIRSREANQIHQNVVHDAPTITVNQPLLSPIKADNKTKSKKYFSQDVRSHFDSGSQFVKDQSFDKGSFDSFRRKGSGDINLSQPIIQIDDANPNEETSPIKRTGSDKLKAMRNANSLQLSGKKGQEKGQVSEDLFVENKLSKLENDQSLSPQLPKLRPMKMQSMNQQIQMQQYAKDVLNKVYKSFRAKLQNEPYSLKALMSERSQNKEQFIRMLPVAIEQVYDFPERDFETSMRLILQISEKVPEATINKVYAEIYHKIAKLESKYGLELSMQKMLPLTTLYQTSTSIDQLFQVVKPYILSVCEFENVQKVSKLISIGFKRSALEQSVIQNFLKRQIEPLNRQKDQDKIANTLQQIKELNTKLNVKMLIEVADPAVKKATSSDLRKMLVKIFAESIRSKGKGREANDLLSRFK